MAITIWRLVTTAAFISSRRTLRFKWTASVRFSSSIDSLSPCLPLLFCLPLLLLLLSALLARCRFSRIATWLVPFANLYAGHDNSLSYTPQSVPSMCRVQSQPAALFIYVARDSSSVPGLACLAWLALCSWSVLGLCLLYYNAQLICDEIPLSAIHTIYHIPYSIHIPLCLLSFMYSPSPLCIPTLSPAFSHAIVVSLAINLSLRIIKFVCSSNYAP